VLLPLTPSNHTFSTQLPYLMREQIQQFIAEGRTEDALALLVQSNSDAVLLQARYNQAKKQQNMGMIDFGEWSRVQAQVNYAALEMAGKVKDTSSSSSSTASNTTTSTSTATKPGKKVFISYNHGDSDVAVQVRDFLEKEGIDVILDQDDMDAGGSIMHFIQESIKKADAMVSIISSKSLQSGWVGQESIASIYAVWLADKKFIPVRLDTVVFDSKFQITALTSIKNKIQELDSDIQTIRELGSDARDLEDDRKRLFDLQKNFSTILFTLKGVLMTEINEEKFSPGMKKVLGSINKM